MSRGSAALDSPVTQTAALAGGPFDRVHLAKQCLGDEYLELEVLRLFDTTIAGYLARLRLASTVDDFTLVLHTLKGASAGVGAFALADLARNAEQQLRSGDPLLPEQIADIAIAVEEARAFIAELLANAPD